ncbi:MAG: DUF7662 domain-containing protein [Fimbriimonadaceae bacterium]
MRVIEVGNALNSLAAKRPLFHSEADFQHGLAWEIQCLWPAARVRLEVPLYGLAGRGALDIVVRAGGQTVAIELKYFKARLEHEHDGDRFLLPPTVARDLARHDLCKDIVRIEHAIGSRQATEGYVVALTNDPGFWRDSGREGVDEAFKLHEGRKLTGTLAWSERAGAGTTKNRDKPLKLVGEYEAVWWPYSDVGGLNGEFRFLVVPVFVGNPESTMGPVGGKEKPAAPSASRGGPRFNRELFREFFATATAPVIELTLEEVEATYGPLPPSAYRHNAWWSGNASHAQAVWELEGYKASPKLAERKVLFRRVR